MSRETLASLRAALRSSDQTLTLTREQIAKLTAERDTALRDHQTVLRLLEKQPAALEASKKTEDRLKEAEWLLGLWNEIEGPRLRELLDRTRDLLGIEDEDEESEPS